IPWKTISEMLDHFTATELRDFAKVIDKNRIDEFLTNRVAIGALQHYFSTNVEVLKKFKCIPDTAWTHVIDKIKKGDSGQISGGHDKAKFDEFVTTYLSAAKGWTTVHNSNIRTGVGGQVEKRRYHFTHASESALQGSKTLIDNLKTNEKTWRTSAE